MLLGAWLLLRFFEPRLVFYPSSRWDVDPSNFAPAQELSFPAPDGVTLSAVWVPSENPEGVVLYCHGNAGNLSHRLPTAALWRDELRLSVLLFDYRGYGRSQGHPTEQGIFIDTLAAFEQAQRLGEQLPILYGRSLGTVPATRVAAEKEVHGLILDSPMTSAREMAGKVLPLPGIGYLTSFKLDNLSTIRKVRTSIFVLHGERDRIIPLEQGQRVYEAAPQPKKFLLLEGQGHNDSRDDPDTLGHFGEFIASLDNVQSP